MIDTTYNEGRSDLEFNERQLEVISKELDKMSLKEEVKERSELTVICKQLEQLLEKINGISASAVSTADYALGKQKEQVDDAEGKALGQRDVGGQVNELLRVIYHLNHSVDRLSAQVHRLEAL